MNRWIAEQSGSAGSTASGHQMQIVARQIVAFFEVFDVLVLPTYLHPQIRVGEWAKFESRRELEKIMLDCALSHRYLCQWITCDRTSTVLTTPPAYHGFN
jgi:Asp-tRNA(Asn)/Glu-tRNA(Gln) amidotransferase A subunit family amidase